MNSYLKHLNRNMISCGFTLQDSIVHDLLLNDVELDDTYEVMDFLEGNCAQDMKVVAFLMSIYTGQTPDIKTDIEGGVSKS